MWISLLACGVQATEDSSFILQQNVFDTLKPLEESSRNQEVGEYTLGILVFLDL